MFTLRAVDKQVKERIIMCFIIRYVCKDTVAIGWPSKDLRMVQSHMVYTS